MTGVAAVLALVLRAAALREDSLFPDEVGHDPEQLQAAIARLGGGDLHDVKHPRDLTHQQVLKGEDRGVGGHRPSPPRRRHGGRCPRPR